MILRKNTIFKFTNKTIMKTKHKNYLFVFFSIFLLISSGCFAPINSTFENGRLPGIGQIGFQ